MSNGFFSISSSSDICQRHATLLSAPCSSTHPRDRGTRCYQGELHHNRRVHQRWVWHYLFSPSFAQEAFCIAAKVCQAEPAWPSGIQRGEEGRQEGDEGQEVSYDALRTDLPTPSSVSCGDATCSHHPASAVATLYAPTCPHLPASAVATLYVLSSVTCRDALSSA